MEGRDTGGEKMIFEEVRVVHGASPCFEQG